MRKNLLSLALALCLLLPGLPSPARAAPGGGMDRFTAVRSYDGRFTDVEEGAWYFDNVTALYEMGLTDGQSSQTFGTNSQVSLAEAVSFAARIHSIYHQGGAQTGPDRYAAPEGPWYAPYVDYLRAAGGIDGRFDGRYGGPATRGQVAYLLSGVLPEEELEERNAGVVLAAHGSGRYIPDVTEATPYKEEILDLYRWGIVTGGDAKGSYRPEATITRGELAAMLTRMVDPSLRVDLTWDLSDLYPARGTTFADLIREDPVPVLVHAPEDLEAIRSNVRYMFKSGSADLALQIAGGTTSAVADAVAERYLEESMRHPEQGYSTISYEYYSDGRMSITFINDNCSRAEQDAALERAVTVHDQFWADGTLRPGMSQREIAKVYFDYLCSVCEYDYTFQDVSHTAYGALCSGKAVCQGYTAAYQIFLGLEGIDCTGVETDVHLWTAATLDGVLYHIDVTWGDVTWSSGPGGRDDSQFCMDPETAWSRSGIGA